MKRMRNIVIVLSVLYIVLGLFLVFLPNTSMMAICVALAGISIICGLIKMISYFMKDPYHLAFQFDLALGIFMLIVGVLLLMHPMDLLILLPIVVGIGAIIEGVFKLQTSIDAKRFGIHYWWVLLLLCVVSIGCGVVLLMNPFKGLNMMVILMGISLIIYGVENLVNVIWFVKWVHQSKPIEVEAHWVD